MGKKDIERTTRKKQNNRDGVDSRSGSSSAAGKGGRGVRAELVFILDASGSMAGLESDTIGGFNALIEENREKSGEASVSLVQFNDRSKVVLDRVPHREGPAPHTEHVPLPGLHGAARRGGCRHRAHRPRPARAACRLRGGPRAVCHHDGRHGEREPPLWLPPSEAPYPQAPRDGWEFLFIGANIDVEHEAESLGLDPDMAVEYIADDIGTGALYEAASIATATVRAGASMASGAWRAGIDEDRRRRGRS